MSSGGDMTGDANGTPRRLRAPAGDEVVYAWISRTQEVMAFRVGDRLVVCSAICPHMGAQLTLDRRRRAVVCPWHGLAFALPDGACEHHRYRRLRLFPATERDGDLDVE
jgi:nitrite reductase/ring-hydroxylating ferredoxin subunit